MDDNKKKRNRKQDAEQTQAADAAETVDATPTEDAAEPQGEQPASATDPAQELAEARDRYLRSKAELENYRRRAQREFSEIREYTKALTVQEFFSVFDHFQMAMDHVQENPDFETLKQGMDMILGEFQRTFEALGVQRVNATNCEFDPNEHEAVSHEPSTEVPAGHVLRQWKCGYRMADRLLRPATVIVSSGPPENAKPDSDDAEK